MCWLDLKREPNSFIFISINNFLTVLKKYPTFSVLGVTTSSIITNHKFVHGCIIRTGVLPNSYGTCELFDHHLRFVLCYLDNLYENFLVTMFDKGFAQCMYEGRARFCQSHRSESLKCAIKTRIICWRPLRFICIQTCAITILFNQLFNYRKGVNWSSSISWLRYITLLHAWTKTNLGTYGLDPDL